MTQPQQSLPLHLADTQPTPAIPLADLFADPAPAIDDRQAGLPPAAELVAKGTETPQRRYRQPKPAEQAQPSPTSTPQRTPDLVQLAAAVSQLIDRVAAAGEEACPPRRVDVTAAVLNALAAERARTLPRPTNAALIERCVTSYILDHAASADGTALSGARPNRARGSRSVNVAAPAGWWIAVNAYCVAAGLSQSDLLCRAVTARRLRDTRPATHTEGQP